MVENKENSKLKDMDDYLKLKLVDLWFEAISLSIAGDYKKTFLAYKMLFKMIEPYNFEYKQSLRDITQLLQEYINSLGGRPVNSSELLILNNSKEEFKTLLDKYTSSLPKAFVDLNLWFKSIPVANDIDLKLSDENFSSELSFIGKKKQVLSKLPIKDLLALFSINAIHDAHARGIMKNVL